MKLLLGMIVTAITLLLITGISAQTDRGRIQSLFPANPRSSQTFANTSQAGEIGISLVCVGIVILSFTAVFILSCYEECFLQPKKLAVAEHRRTIRHHGSRTKP